MMISTKGRYALRVMLDMAEHGGGEWHRLSDVAQRQQLSKKYLETIMAALSRANLVESAVGKSGGRLDLRLTGIDLILFCTGYGTVRLFPAGIQS